MTEVADNLSEALLEVRGLRKWFPVRQRLRSALRRGNKRYIKAVDGIDLHLRAGESLGLAGESGSGKTVTGEMIARLQVPTSGEILVQGRNVGGLAGKDLLEFRRRVNMVLQDPFDTLNPRWTVEKSLLEPLRLHRVGDAGERRERISTVLRKVALEPAHSYARKHPYQLSGGERQRVSIARALILGPSLLVADEPTTMLDVSIRAGLLNLLREIQSESGLSMLFISHDFSNLTYLCDRIAIMYRGRILEYGPSRKVLTDQLHPYTQALAAAIPHPDPHRKRQRVTAADPSTLDSEVSGCPFAPRCPERMSVCDEAMPVLKPANPGHMVACYLYDDGTAEKGADLSPDGAANKVDSV